MSSNQNNNSNTQGQQVQDLPVIIIILLEALSIPGWIEREDQDPEVVAANRIALLRQRMSRESRIAQYREFLREMRQASNYLGEDAQEEEEESEE